MLQALRASGITLLARPSTADVPMDRAAEQGDVPADDDILAASAVLAADTPLRMSVVRGLALFGLAVTDADGAGRAAEIAALLEANILGRFSQVSAGCAPSET